MCTKKLRISNQIQTVLAKNKSMDKREILANLQQKIDLIENNSSVELSHRTTSLEPVSKVLSKEPAYSNSSSEAVFCNSVGAFRNSKAHGKSRDNANNNTAQVFASNNATEQAFAQNNATEQELARNNATEQAFARLVKLVSHRDRSRCELRNKLSSENFNDCEIDDAIQRACDCNLVDDQRFADARIRYLIHKGKGLLGIEQELERHKINICDISGWPDDYIDVSADAEIERAMKLLQRKPSCSKNQLQGNYNKLIREGYSTYVANQAANQFVRRNELLV